VPFSSPHVSISDDSKIDHWTIRMNRNLEKRTNQASLVTKIPLLTLMVGILFLAGCGIGSSKDEPASPTGIAGAQEEQEVAINTSAIETFTTLPPPIIVEASDTPVQMTATPQATATQESTSTPEETEVPVTETFTPVPPTSTAQPAQPTNPPPPPPTETPAPQPTPPPSKGANGLVASHFALQDRSEYSAGGSIWFEFTIANDTGNEVPYNALGVMPKKDGVDRFEWYQQTYGGRSSTINAGGFSWEDRIKLPEPGNYTLRLVMCFDGFDKCLQGNGTWHNMSDEVAIQVN
jgi:hypothetical protein